MPKYRKVTEAFLRLALPLLKVDPDAEGQVGIWKAPLPGGTAELINIKCQYTGSKSEDRANASPIQIADVKYYETVKELYKYSNHLYKVFIDYYKA